ncbi:unnamed protein product [Arctia plantaginis]|uniref:Fatty acyl-CoA reductase n=1 Tax=Arctia plantaginis TaxID=874455 RepID=A0A8S0ZX42_ARCPL|nr:unnamed protein product [Arctia plantaginis]
MANAVSNKSVAEFYAKKCIFLTGGTGFLGKVFIEKLLYSCPEIDTIYILIREKKGLDINRRIKNLFNDPLFERLKDKRPQCLEKLVPISGDMNSPQLGISHDSENTLVEKVSVVIHAAATVKFNEPLKEAWQTNVEGTRMVLELAQRMKLVEVFLHVSTAYSNPDRQVIEEVLYPAPANIDEIQQLVKGDLTDEETLKIIAGRPNTYTFTKALSEHLVAENLVHMPTVIIRPSIVAAIKNDPIKGWLENWYGATGMMASTSKGLNRVFYGKSSNNVDFIPVDYVANLVIAAGAKNCRSRELKIYNCCSSGCNPLPIGKVMKLFIKNSEKYKSSCMPFPKMYTFTRRKWLVSLITLLFQVTPAYIADLFRILAGKRPMYVKLQSRIMQTRLALNYFTSHSWIMKADHTRNLFLSLSASDKKTFPCDPTSIDWHEYFKDYAWGVQRFLEKKTHVQ